MELERSSPGRFQAAMQLRSLEIASILLSRYTTATSKVNFSFHILLSKIVLQAVTEVRQSV